MDEKILGCMAVKKRRPCATGEKFKLKDGITYEFQKDFLQKIY